MTNNTPLTFTPETPEQGDIKLTEDLTPQLCGWPSLARSVNQPLNWSWPTSSEYTPIPSPTGRSGMTSGTRSMTIDGTGSKTKSQMSSMASSRKQNRELLLK
jgi:hypothetical protein